MMGRMGETMRQMKIYGKRVEERDTIISTLPHAVAAVAGNKIDVGSETWLEKRGRGGV